MIPRYTKDISKKWLNEELHKSGFLNNINIDSLSHEPWGEDGYMSDMAKLTVTYDKGDSGLPNTMIAKWPPSFDSAFAFGMQYHLFENEVRCYSEVLPSSPIRAPKLIYSNFDLESKRFGLILEDCSKFIKPDKIKGLNYENLRNAVLTIADFQARWWDSKDLFSFDWMTKPKGPEILSIVDSYDSLWELCKNHPLFKSTVPDGGVEMFEKVRKNVRWLYLDSFPEINLTMTHGDFHADNFFCDNKNKENPIIVFDWTGPVPTRGVFDLVNLFLSSLTLESRRKYEKEMIKLYLQRLSEKVANLSNYTFEEVWHDYLIGLCLAFAYTTIVTATIDLSNEKAVKIFEAGAKRMYPAITDHDALSILPN